MVTTGATFEIADGTRADPSPLGECLLSQPRGAAEASEQHREGEPLIGQHRDTDLSWECTADPEI